MIVTVRVDRDDGVVTRLHSNVVILGYRGCELPHNIFTVCTSAKIKPWTPRSSNGVVGCEQRVVVRIRRIELGKLEGQVACVARSSASEAVSLKPTVTCTGVATIGVCAGCVFAAQIEALGALVDVGAGEAVTGVAGVTRTGVVPNAIDTLSIRAALRCAIGALIDIRAGDSIAHETKRTRTNVGAGLIDTDGVGATSEGSFGAFIDVYACPGCTIEPVAGVA